MKKDYLQIMLILLVVMSSTYASGQSSNYFSHSYCPEGIATIASNIFPTNYGYMMAGAYKDSTNLTVRLYLAHIDTLGLISKIETYGNDTIIYRSGLSGSIIRTSNSESYWTTMKSNLIRDFGVLIKFDSAFNAIWEVDYPFNNDTNYSYLALVNISYTYDHGFVMVGGIESNQNIQDLLIQKTDSLGNIQWRKSFIYKGVSMAQSVIQTPDHGYLLGGGAYEPYVNQSYHGIIIKTDSLGNEQWRKYIGNPGFNNSACIVLNSQDGNYIVVHAAGVDNYTSIAANKLIYVHKITPTGQFLWSKPFGNKMIESWVDKAIIKPNGDIISCGYFYPGDTISHVESYTWLLKTNNNGDSLWMREHYLYNGAYCTNSLKDLKATPDGGYILVGETDSFMYVPQSAWLLKVDSLGCAVPGCHLVGLKEVIMPPEEVLLYPNPATTRITLRLPTILIQEQKEVRVFNSSGQEVLRQPLPTGDPEPYLDISHLQSGIYYLRVIHQDISTVLGKFLKQ